MFNFLLALVASGSTFLAEWIFHFTQGSKALVPLEKYFATFVILLIFSCIKNRAWRFISVNFILVLSFFQMLHVSYYGMPVYPNAFWLLFAEMGEVLGTVKEDLGLFIIPVLISIPLISFNYWLNRRLDLKLKKIPWLQFLFIFYFCYNPLRTFVTDNKWGRQPSTEEFMGMNFYLSSSYFLGKILPYKLRPKAVSQKKLDIVFNPTSKFPGRIVLVWGESLSANHLSLLGYKKNTTPFLDKLKQDPHFKYFRGISSGVSTDISTAYFFNNTFGFYGAADVRAGSKCLFKLAKDNNISTIFYSTQSQQQLRYITNSICPKNIDVYKNLEDLDPGYLDENKADDRLSIKALDEVKMDHGFYVLHQRGNHSPYNLRYPKEFEVFKPTGQYKPDRIIHYDNAVLFFDAFMQKLIQKIKTSKIPTIIIYLSDHGEGLGEEGVWGHAALKRPSIEIPVLVYLHKADDFAPKFQRNPTQLDVSLYLSQLLGYQTKLDYLKNYIIFGNDLDGFAGYLETEWSEGKLIQIKRRNL